MSRTFGKTNFVFLIQCSVVRSSNRKKQLPALLFLFFRFTTFQRRSSERIEARTDSEFKLIPGGEVRRTSSNQPLVTCFADCLHVLVDHRIEPVCNDN